MSNNHMGGLKVKHTPGPWKVGSVVNGIESYRINIAGEDHHHVAKVSSRSDDEIKANATLIAAAPELLEACKAYADKYFSRAKGDLERLTPEARQILNAIAKAENR